MARSSVFVLLSALAASTLAQSSTDSSTGDIVWASYAFVMHGERTPLIGKTREAEVLTPAGAHEMMAQASAFHSRYMRAPYIELEANETGITTRQPIRGLNRASIDNSELNIYALDEPYTSASALAFLQALYPPNEDAFSQALGGDDIARDTSTGELTEYPMGGYQYPAIKTSSILEEQSIFIAGNTRCSSWIKSARNDLMSSGWGDDKNNGRGTDGFYRDVFSGGAFNGTSIAPLTEDDLNIYNSYVIWDFVRYQSAHNKTVADNLKGNGNANDDLDTLAELKRYADEFTFEQNCNTDKSIRTVAGRTLAQQVLQSFDSNYQTDGKRSKLTLSFGSYEPIRAFAALAGLTGDSWSNTPAPWKEIPKTGAAMVFELVGRVPGSPSQYPTHDNLKVRFYYRDGTGRVPFKRHGIFGSSTSEGGMSWSSFEKAMKDVAMTPSNWCSSCNAQVGFCQARSINSVYLPKSKSAVIAGVIGAAVTIAVIGLAVVALVFCCGMRVHKSGRRTSFGGFKGAEKMASDTDLAITNGGGARHERVGSWELRDPPPGGAGLQKTGVTASPRKADDEAIMELGMKPVQPMESV